MFVYFPNLKINYSELFQDYARNLLESGIHGAVISLDNGFDVNAFALALQIPTQNVQVKLRMPNLGGVDSRSVVHAHTQSFG